MKLRKDTQMINNSSIASCNDFRFEIDCQDSVYRNSEDL